MTDEAPGPVPTPRTRYFYADLFDAKVEDLVTVELCVPWIGEVQAPPAELTIDGRRFLFCGWVVEPAVSPGPSSSKP